MEHYRQLRAKEVPRLQELIDELLKENPNRHVVKSAMKSLGLSYSEDPIDCMNQVIQVLHSEQGSNRSGSDQGHRL